MNSFATLSDKNAGADGICREHSVTNWPTQSRPWRFTATWGGQRWVPKAEGDFQTNEVGRETSQSSLPVSLLRSVVVDERAVLPKIH